MSAYIIGGFCFLAVFSLTVPFVEYRPSLGDREDDMTEVEPRLDLKEGTWHTSKKGETLRTIAMHYYGSARQWRTIQIANSAPLVPESQTLLWIPGMRDEIDGLDEMDLSAHRD